MMLVDGRLLEVAGRLTDGESDEFAYILPCGRLHCLVPFDPGEIAL